MYINGCKTLWKIPRGGKQFINVCIFLHLSARTFKTGNTIENSLAAELHSGTSTLLGFTENQCSIPADGMFLTLASRLPGCESRTAGQRYITQRIIVSKAWHSKVCLWQTWVQNIRAEDVSMQYIIRLLLLSYSPRCTLCPSECPYQYRYISLDVWYETLNSQVKLLSPLLIYCSKYFIIHVNNSPFETQCMSILSGLLKLFEPHHSGP